MECFLVLNVYVVNDLFNKIYLDSVGYGVVGLGIFNVVLVIW